MKPFLDDHFLLQGRTAQTLFHEYAASMPIFDYHCHLPPEQIAEDYQWDNLGEIWLAGDHYKWRAMRTNGVEERLITGASSWKEKFDAWAATVPHTMRNPLYHWSHLELKRYFGIETLLSPATADEIYETATAQLRTSAFSARNLMRNMKVKVVCTTDDPADDLRHHLQIREDGFEVKVLPTFRPDRAMNLSDTGGWKAYLDRLGEAAQLRIESFVDLMEALEKRHAFFHSVGGRLSDHGVLYVPDADATPAELETIFQRALRGEQIGLEEREKFEAVFLYEVGKMNHARGWAQQFHVGAFRNNNRRMFHELGPDAGYDSIADATQGPEEGGTGLEEKIEAFKEMIERVQVAYPNASWFGTTLREVQSANRHLWGALVSHAGAWEIIKPREIGVLDRIGGGDGFVGGLLYGILKGWSVDKCTQFGWASGALAATMLTDYVQPVDEEQLWNIWEGNARVKR